MLRRQKPALANSLMVPVTLFLVWGTGQLVSGLRSVTMFAISWQPNWAIGESNTDYAPLRRERAIACPQLSDFFCKTCVKIAAVTEK
jgi:hypothetical protein